MWVPNNVQSVTLSIFSLVLWLCGRLTTQFWLKNHYICHMHKSSKYEYKMKGMYCILYYQEMESWSYSLFFVIVLFFPMNKPLKDLSLLQMWYFLIQNWLSKESQICGYNAIRNNGQSQLYLIVLNVYTQQKPNA